MVPPVVSWFIEPMNSIEIFVRSIIYIPYNSI